MQEDKPIEAMTADDYRIPFQKEDSWRKFLAENGFVVIANYLPPQKCEEYVEEFWGIMEYLSEGSLNRKDPETQVLGKYYPPVLHGGMIQYIGHSEPQWQIRRLCRPLFEKVWNTNDLKTSFDGFCFMNGRRNYKPRSDDAFLHVDQSPTKDFIWSYQGIMTLTDAGPKGGGFVCVPGSHKHHQEYFKKKKMSDYKDNWYMVPDKEKGKQPFANVLKINSRAGDFILFDSRTFHCNTVPTERESLRVCTYVCMIPEEKVPETVLEKREKAVEKRKTSNHHPGDGFKTFPDLPRYLDDRKRFESLVKKVNSYELNAKDKELI